MLLQRVPFPVCSVKLLPQEQWISAAGHATAINPANAAAVHMLGHLFPEAVIPPQHIAVLTQKYWGAAGVRLTVGFLDNPPADLRARILTHMNALSRVANVQFSETASDAQVRIARTPGDGYWSFLGTDILSIGSNQKTMNLDSFTMNTADSEFHRVIRHETGHTLGFPHEHMRAQTVDRIDQEKAISYFMRTQHWSRDQVVAQVLTPLDNSALIATANADPQSIMCYWLPAEIMKDGVAVTGGSDIDLMDAQFAASLYPKQVGAAFKATLQPGQSLHPGQTLQSNNKLHTLKMQEDGNVVLYDRNSRPLWATNTGSLITPRELIMQTDGNLVLYSTDGQARWASNTWNNPGAFLDVQDDGNLVVYKAGSRNETADNALWASASNDI